MKLHKVNDFNIVSAHKVQGDAMSEIYVATQLFKQDV
jgi:hypothetical protein